MADETTTVVAPETAPEVTPEAPLRVDTRSQAKALIDRHRAAEPAPEGTETPEAAMPASTDSVVPTAAQTVQTYKDPQTGKFIKKEEALARGIGPETPAEATPTGMGLEDAGAETTRPDTTTAEPETVQPITVRVKDRGGADLDIPLPAGMDPLHVEAIQTAAKDGMRRAQFHEQMRGIENDRAELDEFKHMLSDRPEQILPAHIPSTKKAAVALALLEDPQVYDQVSNTIDEWSADPAKRRDSENQRLRDELNRERSEAKRTQLKDHFSKLETAIETLIPENTEDAQADRFFRDACRDLEDKIRTDRRMIQPADVPTIVQDRLRQYGFADAAESSTTPASAPPSARTAGNGARPGGLPATGSPAPGTATDRRLLATTPPGSGARVGSGKPVPKDITLKSATSYLRERFGRG